MEKLAVADESHIYSQAAFITSVVVRGSGIDPVDTELGRVKSRRIAGGVFQQSCTASVSEEAIRLSGLAAQRLFLICLQGFLTIAQF
jgi:hypothetical protein